MNRIVYIHCFKAVEMPLL